MSTYRNQYHGALSVSVDGLAGPTGDWAADTTTLQSYLTACLSTGQAIVIPPGDWHITTPLRYTFTSGDHAPLILGYGHASSRIYNETDTEYVLQIVQSGASQYAFGGGIFDVGFYGPSANRINEGCVRLRGVWNFNIARCWFQNAKRHGVWIDNADGTDAYASPAICIEKCVFDTCDDHAIFLGNSSGNKYRQVATVRDCGIFDCGGGIAGGFTLIDNCQISNSSTSPQITIDSDAATHFGCIIRNCAFEGGKGGGELLIKSTSSVIVENCRFAGTYIGTPPSTSYGIKLGAVGETVTDFYINNCSLSYDDATLTTFTGIDMTAYASQGCILNCSFPVFDATYTKYNNDGTYNSIQQNGGYLKPPGLVGQVDTSVGSGETFTPNLEASGSYYRLNITAVAPSKPTIANPVGMSTTSEDAFCVYVTILNQTGVNIDPSTDITWGNDWAPLSTTVANNRWAVAQFIWDGTNTKFFQVAEWAVHT